MDENDDHRRREFLRALEDFERSSARLSSLARDLRIHMTTDGTASPPRAEAGPAPTDPSPTSSPVSPPSPWQPPPSDHTGAPPVQPPRHDDAPPEPFPGTRQPFPPRQFPPRQPGQPPYAGRPTYPGTPPAPVAPLPTVPHEPWWKDEKKAMRVFASVGALITIAGVGLLVALAIQRGLLGVAAQVTLAYVLAAVLVGCSFFVQHRMSHAVGSTALMVTGVTAAHITTGYVTVSLDWWPIWVGALLTIAVGSVGLVAGGLWRIAVLSLLNALVTVVAVLLFSDHDPSLSWVPAAALAFAFASALVWWRRPDQVVSTTVSVAALLLGVVFLATGSRGLESGLVVAVLVVGAAAMFLTVYRGTTDTAFTATAVVLAGATGPVVAVAALRPWTGLLGAAVSLAFGVVGLYLHRRHGDTVSPVSRLTRFTAVSGLVSTAIPLLFLALAETNSLWKAPVAAGFVVVAATLALQRSPLLVPALPVWFIAAHLAVSDALPYLFTDDPLRISGWRSVAVNLTQDLPSLLFLLLGNAVMVYLAVQAGPPLADNVRKVCGLAGLLFMAVPVVLTVIALGGPFALGHILVSIGWMLAAAVLLLRPSATMETGNAVAGAVVIAAVAVVKLVFFDLSALGGVLRVIVFIVCGLLLLAMAVLRSRRDRSLPDGPVAATSTGPTGAPGAEDFALDTRTAGEDPPTPRPPHAPGM